MTDKEYTLPESDLISIISTGIEQGIRKGLAEDKAIPETIESDVSYSKWNLIPDKSTSKNARYLKILNMLENKDHCMVSPTWYKDHLKPILRVSGYRVTYVTHDQRYTCWIHVDYDTHKAMYLVKHPTLTEHVK